MYNRNVVFARVSSSKTIVKSHFDRLWNIGQIL